MVVGGPVVVQFTEDRCEGVVRVDGITREKILDLGLHACPVLRSLARALLGRDGFAVDDVAVCEAELAARLERQLFDHRDGLVDTRLGVNLALGHPEGLLAGLAALRAGLPVGEEAAEVRVFDPLDCGANLGEASLLPAFAQLGELPHGRVDTLGRYGGVDSHGCVSLRTNIAARECESEDGCAEYVQTDTSCLIHV